MTTTALLSDPIEPRPLPEPGRSAPELSLGDDATGPDAERTSRQTDGTIGDATAERPADPPDITKLQALFQGPVDVRSISLTGLFLLACLAMLSVAEAVFIPIAFALILSALLTPLVRSFRFVRIGPPLAAAIVLGGLVLVVAVASYLLLDPASQWMAKAPSAMHAVEHKLASIKQSLKPVQSATAAIEQIAAGEKTVSSPVQVEVKGEGLAATVVAFTKSFFASMLTTLVLVYFLLAGGDFFLEKLVKVIPKLADKKRAVEIVREIEHCVSNYLQSVTLINIGVGLAVGVAMAALGLPNPVLWGVLAMLLHFIPYVGSLTGLLMITLVAFVTFDDLWRVALTAVTYEVISAAEGMIISPLLLGHRLTLNPVVILISLIFWGWLWGIPGALLAVPLLASFKIMCDHLDPLKSIGEFLGR